MREDLLGLRVSASVHQSRAGSRDEHGRVPSGFARLVDRLSRARRRSRGHLRKAVLVPVVTAGGRGKLHSPFSSNGSANTNRG